MRHTLHYKHDRDVSLPLPDHILVTVAALQSPPSPLGATPACSCQRTLHSPPVPLDYGVTATPTVRNTSLVPIMCSHCAALVHPLPVVAPISDACTLSINFIREAPLPSYLSSHIAVDIHVFLNYFFTYIKCTFLRSYVPRSPFVSSARVILNLRRHKTRGSLSVSETVPRIINFVIANKGLRAYSPTDLR